MSNKLKHFLRKLISSRITVVLKNDTVVEGKCFSVDSTMNIHLRGVVEITPTGKQNQFETYSIRGSKILWIEFPENINTDYFSN